MNRMWWGLFGVAILASQTGCRNSCGERRFQLFNRDRDSGVAGRLMNRAPEACPTGAFASQLGYPATAPVYEGMPIVPGPGPGYSGPPMAEPTIPPTYLPATPVPAIPSAKNVLPLPKELVPPTGVTGYGK